ELARHRSALAARHAAHEDELRHGLRRGRGCLVARGGAAAERRGRRDDGEQGANRHAIGPPPEPPRDFIHHAPSAATPPRRIAVRITRSRHTNQAMPIPSAAHCTHQCPGLVMRLITKSMTSRNGPRKRNRIARTVLNMARNPPAASYARARPGFQNPVVRYGADAFPRSLASPHRRPGPSRGDPHGLEPGPPLPVPPPQDRDGEVPLRGGGPWPFA